MLPKGITGFRDLDGVCIPEHGEKEFKQFCYSVAVRHHYTVISFDLDLVSKNFYSAEFKTGQGRLYLLENAYYPWAAAEINLSFAGIEFIECPFDLTEQNVRLLTLSELRQDWHGFVGKLSSAELRQIAYWKPKTIGDIVFNFWD